MKLLCQVVCVVAVTSGSAWGGVIDLLNLPDNTDQSPWGHPDATLFAQSVEATGSLFEEFRFQARSPSIGGVDFTLVVTGARPDIGGLGFAPDFTDIRYESPQHNVPGGDQHTELTINPNLAVLEGETLFLVLNTYTIASTGRATVRTTQILLPIDQYEPGEFVFLTTNGPGTALSDLIGAQWTHRASSHQDLAIRAVFTPSPGPAALLASGLVLGVSRRRRSTATK